MSGPWMTAGRPQTPFEQLAGGEDLVVRIARSFYARMADMEPALARLHELDERGQISERTQERFTRFLIEWLGGPANYSPREGHPRLRMRHATVPIDSAMRDAWMRCMTSALDEQGVKGEVRAFLDLRFGELATFLQNRTDGSSL
jgi:hemoglobin